MLFLDIKKEEEKREEKGKSSWEVCKERGQPVTMMGTLFSFHEDCRLETSSWEVCTERNQPVTIMGTYHSDMGGGEGEGWGGGWGGVQKETNLTL